MKREVRELAKRFCVYDEKLINILISDCYKRYEAERANGNTDEEARRLCLEAAELAVRSHIKPRNPYEFILKTTIFALILSLIEILWRQADMTEIYTFDMTVAAVGFLGLFVYAVVTRRKRYWYDYVILAVLAVAWTASCLQLQFYLLRGSLPDRYWIASYVFPCMIRMDVYRRETIDAPFLQTGYDILWSFQFLASLISFVAVFIAFIKHNKKKRNKK